VLAYPTSALKACVERYNSSHSSADWNIIAGSLDLSIVIDFGGDSATSPQASSVGPFNESLYTSYRRVASGAPECYSPIKGRENNGFEEPYFSMKE